MNTSTQKIKKPGPTLDYDNNLVGFCFSCDYKILYPNLTQTAALETAAKTLQINKNTLHNIMSYFDYLRPDSTRHGFEGQEIEVRNKILNEYNKNDKTKEEAYKKAKIILKIK